jgi:hypothetical protein
MTSHQPLFGSGSAGLCILAARTSARRKTVHNEEMFVGKKAARHSARRKIMPYQDFIMHKKTGVHTYAPENNA